MTPFIRILTVNATGERFIVISETYDKVRTRGPVFKVSGIMPVCGTDKVFKRSHVHVEEVDMTEQLMSELLLEGTKHEIKF